MFSAPSSSPDLQPQHQTSPALATTTAHAPAASIRRFTTEASSQMSRSSPLFVSSASLGGDKAAAAGDSPSASSTPPTARASINTKSMDYVVRSGIAGGVAGCVAKTLIAPLDRVKILFQTSNPEFKRFAGSWLGFYKAMNQIRSSQGFTGLFQGHSATLLRIFPYAAIKFVAYEEVRSIIIPSPDKETGLRRLLAGSISGITSVFFTYPLDLIRVRLAFETKQNAPTPQPPSQSASVASTGSASGISTSTHHKGGRLIQTCFQIFNENPSAESRVGALLPTKVVGVSNFYRGFTPTIVGMIPYAGVSFWAHDLFHDIFRSEYLAPYAVMDFLEPDSDVYNVNRDRATRKPLTVWAQLTAGGLAGMCSQTASYPLEVIRRRIQVSGVTGERTSMIQTAQTIFAKSGFRGFFVGLSIGYIKVTPMFACSFFVYERMKLLLGI